MTTATVSPVSASTMATASAVSPPNTFAGSFHNLTNHVILSPSSEDADLALSSSSSFLSNFSSGCSNTSKSTIPSNFVTSTFTFNSDTKENNSSTASNTPSMNQNVEQEVKEDPAEDIVNKNEFKNKSKIEPATSPVGLQTNNDSKEEVKAPLAISISSQVTEFDDNSNSNSTQSSDNTNGSIRKKRRRGEDQILMEDLIGIDKALADGITNHLKSSSPSSIPVENNHNDLNDSSNHNGDGEPKKSKEDSPAFHLRPRRSNKASSISGYCSSGSQSPIPFLSPIKRSKQPLVKRSINSYTQQLLSDTSKQLSQFLNEHSNHSGHNDCSKPAINSSSTLTSLAIKEETDGSALVKLKTKPSRTFVNSILRNVDVSVFAEMISPLNITYNFTYNFNYIAMQIVDIKPLRYVSLTHPINKGKISCPLLEFITVDINDRFTLSHTKGIFDDPSITEASDKRLTIFLLGTYALKSFEIGIKGEVVNLINFRTSKLTKNDPPQQPPKKRKLVASPKKDPTNKDEEPENYAFHVIVDSLEDIESFNETKPELLVKEELPDNSQQTESTTNSHSDGFADIFDNSPPITESKFKWVPLVSFSAKWRAPEDPKELNKSLYVLQPCIPKFESSSRTVKM